MKKKKTVKNVSFDNNDISLICVIGNSVNSDKFILLSNIVQHCRADSIIIRRKGKINKKEPA